MHCYVANDRSVTYRFNESDSLTLQLSHEYNRRRYHFRGSFSDNYSTVRVRSSVTIVYSVNQLMFVCKHGAKMSARITAVHITMPKNIDDYINQSNKFTTLDVVIKFWIIR